ncbi:hypothetical protein GOEFS_106_00300 [Gordonia effusa NBRC 100432]|uniref:Lipase n=1 Tax=Gordonia effusa NBRC 100432 TaxID=1077974 RepID=H0R4Y3_9ACTN|nr:lipase [Gordonia effusa]GAB20134.1 hypothetical protein GOEFS_106_00300 [Gordonia effusa NBRC 100432]
MPLDAELSLPAASAAYRLLYSTKNQRGPAVSTAALFLPKGEPPAGGWPIIAWAHGTVGLGDNCTPSAQPVNERQVFYFSHWLKRGYAVLGTDYAGLGTPGLMSYLNGRVEAHNLVDSVKASQQMNLPLSRKWALVGQSQGAGAAMNGARYATEFGPELDYRGVVATGTPANVELFLLFGAPFVPPIPVTKALTAYLIYIIAGFRDARPDLRVNSILSPLGLRLADKAEKMCLSDFEDYLAGNGILSGFLAAHSLGSLFSWPVITLPNIYGALRDYMRTPGEGYNRPIFLGHGLFDIDVPITLPASLVAELTLHRQPFQLHLYASDHRGTVYQAANDAAVFMKAIMR